MNEPNNEKLMKIMIRLKGSVGNIAEPFVRYNGNDNGSGSYKKNPARVNLSSGEDDKWKTTCYFCREEHIIYKCESFRNLSVQDRKKFVAENDLCTKCLCRHSMADCRRDWGPCGRDGCDQMHNRLLHETVQNGIVSTVCKNSYLTAANSMFMVQVADLLNGDGERHPGVLMWDSGSSVNLVRRSYARKMKMEPAAHSLMISAVGQSSKMKCEVVKFRLLDRNGISHEMYAGVLDEIISSKVVSLDPKLAAKVFGRRPLEFSAIDDNVDILLGMTKMSIVPISVATVGEVRLYESSFGTGAFIVHTADDVSAISSTVDDSIETGLDVKVCKNKTYLPKISEMFTESGGEVAKLPQASKVDYFGSTYISDVSEKSTEISGEVLKLSHTPKVIEIDGGTVDLVHGTGVEPTANSTTDDCYQLQGPGRQAGNVFADRDQSGCLTKVPYDGGGVELTVRVEPKVVTFNPGGMLLPMFMMMFQLCLLFGRMIWLVVIPQRL